MNDRICTEESCELPTKARGLCRNHYARLQRLGLIPPKQYQTPVCTVDGCETKPHGANMCMKHYARFRKTGSTADPIPRRRATCTVEDCGAPAAWQRLCSKHVQRVRRTGTTDLAPRITVCSVDGCTDSPGPRSGLCAKHYTRLWRHGDPLAIKGGTDTRREQHQNWVGDDVTYRGLHSRLARERGSARGYDCVDCGKPGVHWSYDYTCSEEQRTSRGSLYSAHLEHYAARCASCHVRFDRAHGIARKAS